MTICQVNVSVYHFITPTIMILAKFDGALGRILKGRNRPSARPLVGWSIMAHGVTRWRHGTRRE